MLQIAANIALVKNLTFHGIFWGAHQVAQPRIFRRTLEESAQWLAEGKVRVPVSHKWVFAVCRQSNELHLTTVNPYRGCRTSSVCLKGLL